MTLLYWLALVPAAAVLAGIAWWLLSWLRPYILPTLLTVAAGVFVGALATWSLTNLLR